MFYIKYCFILNQQLKRAISLCYSSEKKKKKKTFKVSSKAVRLSYIKDHQYRYVD